MEDAARACEEHTARPVAMTIMAGLLLLASACAAAGSLEEKQLPGVTLEMIALDRGVPSASALYREGTTSGFGYCYCRLINRTGRTLWYEALEPGIPYRMVEVLGDDGWSQGGMPDPQPCGVTYDLHAVPVSPGEEVLLCGMLVGQRDPEARLRLRVPLYFGPLGRDEGTTWTLCSHDPPSTSAVEAKCLEDAPEHMFGRCIRSAGQTIRLPGRLGS